MWYIIKPIILIGYIILVILCYIIINILSLIFLFKPLSYTKFITELELNGYKDNNLFDTIKRNYKEI